ncbi:MAG TPA: anhydro-N-acetylmuramic acid kinase [Candidatus Sulfotelmatobacter sp.]|nr:anhydro-N-acetylmuramic acid kinase [Candidatus Sulfotelmatobacter sp.]
MSGKRRTRHEMIVAGVMSGTSADGINVALVRIGGRRASATRFELLGHAEYSYPERVRAAVLAAMNAPQASVPDLSRLNSLLGELYAEAVLATQRRFRMQAALVGCHGQTLYHQGEAAPYLGRRLTATWQTGESAIVAARLRVPVVSDFRPADLAAGGKGAPLVPFLDYMLFRDTRVGRIIQNIGGIANLTALPAGASASDVIAFDTGPGNMVIDAVIQQLFDRPFDRNGKIAASGTWIEPVIEKILQRAFFRSKPPKTAGREEFGREFVRDFLRICGNARKRDIVATATALTARSIADAVGRLLPKRSTVWKVAFREMVVSGGGAKNARLMAILSGELEKLGLRLRFSDEFGVPSEAKEAVAFAVLAYETWHRRPSNIPSATGATRPAVLGKISYP